MAKDILHVVPHEQAWAVKREGNERVSSTHSTQHDAIESAREMAKERDDIVIHRPDGTIRERVTYTGTNGGSDAAPERGERRVANRTTALEPRDLVPVGSRVSWGAVLGGAAVGLALYVVLVCLALAIGLSTVDHIRGRTFAISAAAISAVAMLCSVFLGGFVASQLTAGEQHREGAVYGILVWGTMVAVILMGSLGLGSAAALRMAGAPVSPSFSPDRMKQELTLSDQQAQRYSALVKESSTLIPDADAKQAAWWTFVAVALSLLSAVGGGIAGAGPELALERVRDTRGAVAVEPRPA
jgi:Uncharacterized protein conserved in bacteria (DUF2188)